MLKKLSQLTLLRSFKSRRLVHTIQSNSENYQVSNSQLSNENSNIHNEKSVLEPLSEDISHISTYLKPTFNFAAYANKSETIQELVKLGVNLYIIEKKNTEFLPFILGLKFDTIKDHIIFLNQLGLKNEEIAALVTKNPFIFRENLENLEVRITYLKSKRFTDEVILRIVGKNPFWLSHSTQDIDERLGFFQKNFTLSGNEVRSVAAKKPKLVTYKLEKIKLNIFVMKEEMGFNLDEMKKIILRKPSLFMAEQNKLLKTFEYLHNTMKIPLERIAEIPEILSCRERRLKQRHQFLVKLGRDQFNPKEVNYTGLMTLVSGSDANFAAEVAKSSVQTYNMFLKTM